MTYRTYRILFNFIPWLLVYLSGAQVNGQTSPVVFEKFLIEDGMASVNSILRDRDGFIWFGGTHGLYRFDGYRFRKFQTTPKGSASLSNNNVTCLFQDSKGLIWIGTMFGGINRYNPADESVTNLKTSIPGKLYNNNYITCISEDVEGRIWIGTFGEGVYIYNPHNNTTENIKKKGDDSGLSDNDIFSILSIGTQVWVTSNSGILDSYSLLQKRFQRYTYYKDGFSGTRTGQRMCYDGKKNIWIGTEGKGLFRFDLNTKRFEDFGSDNSSRKTSSLVITDLTMDSSGLLWLTTDGGGVNLVNTRTMDVKHMISGTNSSCGLTNNSQYCIFKDISGILWIGMGDGSVNRTFKSPFKVYQRGKLSSEVIVSLAAKEDALWIGSGGGGLDKLDLATDTFSNYGKEIEAYLFSTSNIIMSVLFDRSGYIWASNFKKGVNRLGPIGVDKKNILGDQVNFPMDESLVFDLAEDQKGQIWIATYDRGLYQYDYSRNKMNRIYYNGLSKSASNKLTRLLIDTSNRLWIGTLSKGIYVLNLSDYSGISLPEKVFRQLGHLQNNPIRDIYEDNEGSIWVASEGAGLTRINLQKQQVEIFSTNRGLPTNSVYGIIQDQSNDLWLATNKGITYLERRGGRTTTFSTHDGLPTNDFESGATAAANDGRLFFGSKNGLISFNPKEFKKARFPINLQVTGLNLLNQEVEVHQEIRSFVPLHQSILHTQSLELPKDLDNFSFEFASLGYPNPHRISYEYKLDGIDEDWILAEKGRYFATYSNLDPGNYVFRVRAFEEGFRKEAEVFAEKSLKVRILAPWWATTWARLIYFILFAILVYILYSNFKNRSRLRNELLLEKYQREKEAEISQAKLNFFTAVSHELRTSLTLILAPISELSKGEGFSIRTNNLLDVMNRNARRLMNLTNQILDFRKMESDTVPLIVSEMNISHFIEEVCLPFSLLAEERKIAFEQMIQPEMRGWIDAAKLEIIIFNFLSNAFKFGLNRVELIAQLDEKQLVIHVCDDGKGIPKEEQSAVFDSYHQYEETAKEFVGTGLGLAITKNLVQLHKGRTEVRSKAYEKTEFILHIPVDKNAYHFEEIEKKTSAEKESNPTGEPPKPLAVPITGNLDSERDILMIVEDNCEIRGLLERNLNTNYQIVSASNGLEGLELAYKVIPDLIISDVMMPKMNGLELCSLIKQDERTSHIPVVLLTARSSHIFKIEGYEFGADDYVTKPFDMTLLERRLSNLLKSRKLLQEKFRKQIRFLPSEIASNDGDETFLKGILDAIDRNLTDADFTIETLAREMGMSHSVLYRKIRALSGQNISDFVRSYKLNRAKELLTKSSMSINQIGDAVGFSDAKYFSTCFRKEFGVPPSVFREKASR